MVSEEPFHKAFKSVTVTTEEGEVFIRKTIALTTKLRRHHHKRGNASVVRTVPAGSTSLAPGNKRVSASERFGFAISGRNPQSWTQQSICCDNL